MAETHGLNQERLEFIEEQARELEKLTLANPDLRAPQFQNLLTFTCEAVNEAYFGGRVVFLCDLQAVDGRCPTVEDLMVDPELAAVWRYLSSSQKLEPWISTRLAMPGSRELENGCFLPENPRGATEERFCLILVPVVPYGR